MTEAHRKKDLTEKASISLKDLEIGERNPCRDLLHVTDSVQLSSFPPAPDRHS